MTVKFRDLYQAIRGTEVALRRMDVDIAAAMCGMPKCILSEEQENLIDSYLELSNIDVDFCDLDFQAIIQKLEDCFHCVTDEFKGVLPAPLPEPELTIDNCVGGTVIPIEHIKRFRIYERTYTHVSIPSPIQVYIVTKDSMPYSFEPSVPETYSSHEKYYVYWNSQRNSLVVKCDHDTFPESMGVPTGSYNISYIVAEIDDQFQSGYGGVTEVRACTALLMSEGVVWKANNGLERAVDGDPNTYSSVDNSPPEVVVEFQFKV